MSDTKWTPGKWQAFIPIDGDRWTVASHQGPLVADCGIGENKYSGANAQLIAAAPEMTEALEDMLSGWRYIREQHGDLYGVGWERAEQKAVSALAKARGES